MALPKFKSYRKYSRTNYGVNSLKMEVGEMTLYFIKQNLAAYILSDKGKARIANAGFWRRSEQTCLAAIRKDLKILGFEDAQIIGLRRNNLTMQLEIDLKKEEKVK